MDAEQEVLLLLGGDRGPVRSTMERTIVMLGDRAGRVLAVGREHWTEPWGFVDSKRFLNKAVLLATTLAPAVLMEELLEIEHQLGRRRTPGEPPGPRTIDIDILLYGSEVVDQATIIVPHPRMHQRRFALAPAADVAPSMVHPLMGLTVLELLNAVERR